MSDPLNLDLVLGTRGAFVPQSPTDLTLTLGPIPGAPGSHVNATISATITPTGNVFTKPVHHATLSATIQPIALIYASPIWPANFSATISPVGLPIQAAFDPNIVNYLEAGGGLPWSDGERAVGDHDAPWSETALTLGGQVLPWQGGERLAPVVSIPWRDADELGAGASLPWKQGDSLRVDDALPWRDADRVRAAVDTSWRDGARIRVDDALPWRDAARLFEWHDLGWQRGAFNTGLVRLPWQRGHTVFGQRDLPWRDGGFVETHGGPPIVPIPVEPPPNFIPTDLTFCVKWRWKNPLLLDLILGLNPCGSGPSQVVVPIRSVYVVTNVVSLTRVDGDVVIPTLSMNLNLDVDSWAWSFSASVPGQALADLLPVDGVPVELEAEVNGVLFRLMVEKLTRDRRFGDSRLSVQGRGKTAMLDAPYSPVMTFGNDADRTVQQLANEVLTFNGVPIGWSVEWNMLDWLVPGDAWATQGTYINALTNIAQGAGGYLQPHNTEQMVIFLAKYPVLPWEWGPVTADFELPSAVVTQEGIEWIDKVVYDRVFVAGTNEGGMLGRVTRAGTAGGLVAPMVSEALATHADAVRSRGSAVLGDVGRQALVTLRLPVLEETGIIKPGKFVRYVDGATTRLGLVRSVGVAAGGMANVWQTIQVETHENA